MPDFVKIFISKDDLETDCSRLAKQMSDAGYSPDIVVGGMARRRACRCLRYRRIKNLGKKHRHFPVTGKSYELGVGNRSHLIRIYHIFLISHG